MPAIRLGATMTESPDRVLIIVPAWNEARNVGHHGARDPGGESLRTTSPSSMTDRSTRTGAVAREAGATVLTMPFNLGVGGAMRTGFTYAQRHGLLPRHPGGRRRPAQPRRHRARCSPGSSTPTSRSARASPTSATTRSADRARWAMIFLAKVLSRVAKTRLTDVTSGFRAAGPRAIDQYVRYYPAEYFGDTLDSLVARLPRRADGHAGACRDACRACTARPSQGAVGATHVPAALGLRPEPRRHAARAPRAPRGRGGGVGMIVVVGDRPRAG